MEEKKTYVEDDEITLKELILKVQEFFWEVVRNWKLVILILIPIILYMVYKAYKIPVTYSANLTFMINEDNGSSLGGLGNLAASFGFGGSTKGDYNLEKMISLLNSRNIIQQALFEKVNIEGIDDYYANHMIREYDMHKGWEDSDLLRGFYFTETEVDSFSRKENRVLKQLHRRVVGRGETKGILESNINEETGILSLSVKSPKEELSLKFINVIFAKLEKFYVNKSIEKQQQTFVIMSNKVDSIRQTLNTAQYKLLKFKDTQRNLSLRQYKAEELILQREIQALGMAYGEALKNQEVADFSLRSKTPFVQVIDHPIPPLAPNKTIMTYINNVIFGFFLGCFLAVLFIISRKIFRDAMS